MNIQRERALQGIHNHLVWAGVVFVIIYWFIESAVHSYWFDEGHWLLHVFQPSVHELWMRMIVAVLLIVFSFYGQTIINQRKRAELAIIQREKEAQRILENNPAAIILVDCDSRLITYANNNALNMIGASPEALLGKRCHRFLCPSQKGQCPVLDLGQRVEIAERELRTAQKKTVPVLKSVTEVQYKGKPHLLEAFFDITEQKKMQIAIQQAHAELNQIFQTASVGMRLIDRNFNILKVNQAFSELSGFSSEKAIGRKCYDVFAGNMCHGPACPLKQILDGRKLEDYEVSKTRSDGSVITCDLTATRFEGPDGIIGIVEAFKDISELKRIQNELMSERDRLHRILFHQFEHVGIVNDRYFLEYQNELLKKQTAGKGRCRCYEVFRDRDRPCGDCLLQKALESGKIQRFEFDTAAGRSYQHTYTPFVDNNGQKKAVVSQRDITERKASIATALRAEQLAALGELAAGVAHEINNPINGIINYAQMLVNKTKTDDPLNSISGRIIGEGDRIAAIVASLLSFSRRENEKLSIVSIAELLEESVTLTGAQLRKDGIVLSVNMDDQLLPVSARAQEIEQVFLNIINNSRYALNEKYPQGSELKSLDIDVSMIADNGKSIIRACFTDHGPGIPPHVIEKVINPFFSTKPKGKGTGLGLSISHRIVENHGGRLAIESEEGEYTKVTVDLPVQSGN
ncbi:PAS domain S-box protein [Desulfosarcina sp.]|uniref:PAS domain S-box protein n=1 Tax=Desulfosarcina sp. TaxID=2027861 RepID=UPI003569137C